MEKCPKVWFDTVCYENPWSVPNVCTGDRRMGIVLKAYWHWYILIYLLTAVGLSSGGSSTVNIYTPTIHRKKQLTTNWEECGPCPVFASYTLAFALQLRKKHGKTSVRVAEKCQLLRWCERDSKQLYIAKGIMLAWLAKRLPACRKLGVGFRLRCLRISHFCVVYRVVLMFVRAVYESILSLAVQRDGEWGKNVTVLYIVVYGFTFL